MVVSISDVVTWTNHFRGTLSHDVRYTHSMEMFQFCLLSLDKQAILADLMNPL
jgi:hypothetical protein